MKFSKNRIEAYNEALTYLNDKSINNYLNHYFSFFLYHNSWKNISKNNFSKIENLYKGSTLTLESTTINKQEKFEWNNEYAKIPKENEKILINLLDFLQMHKLNVVFVVPTIYFKEQANAELNTAISIIENRGYKVINFNNVNELDIDYKTDFFNSTHLNVYGSTKYTLYFSRYLKENYDLPDHREDEKYKSWSKEYKRFKKDFNKLTNKNFEDILLEYQNN